MGSDEKNAQITGFSINAGDAGYLRESIGSPHAYSFLVPEAFATLPKYRENGAGPYDSVLGWYGPDNFPAADEVPGFDPTAEPEFVSLGEDEGYVAVSAELMEERLPTVLRRIKSRYSDDPEAAKMATKSARDFVQLAKEREAQGKRPAVYVSY